jgi:hypothetical protein
MEPLRGKWLGPLVGALTGVLIVGAAALGVTATTDGGSSGDTTARSAAASGSTTGAVPQQGGTWSDDHAERRAQMEEAREAMEACLTERGVDVPERPEPGTRPEGVPPRLDDQTRAAIEACHEELEEQGLAPAGPRGEGSHCADGDHGPMRGPRGGGPMGDHGPGGRVGEGQWGGMQG